jgi:hypothetical protein
MFFERISNDSQVEGLVSYAYDILEEIHFPREDPAPLINEVILLAKILFRSKRKLTINRLADMSRMRPEKKGIMS